MNFSKSRIRILLASGGLAVLPVAHALAKPASPASSNASPASANPGLPPEVKAIHCLVGEWRGSASGKLGKDALSTPLDISCTETSGGFGVQCKTRFSGFPGGGAEETDLFGFDPGQRKYHWFSVTNQGETHDHVAEVPKGDTLRFVYDGVHEGKPSQEVILLKISPDHRTMEFQTTFTVGGEQVVSFSGRGTK